MSELRILGSLVVSALMIAGLSIVSSGQDAADDAGGERVYELRTYTTHPGRLPALHKRFKDHTMRLFEKHGMKNVIYWTPVDKEETLVYVLEHKSRQAANESWKGFRSDPEWLKAKEASEKDAPIVMKVESIYLKPTEYSPHQ